MKKIILFEEEQTLKLKNLSKGDVYLSTEDGEDKIRIFLSIEKITVNYIDCLKNFKVLVKVLYKDNIFGKTKSEIIKIFTTKPEALTFSIIGICRNVK